MRTLILTLALALPAPTLAQEEIPRFQPAPFYSPRQQGPNLPERVPGVSTEGKRGARLRQLDKMTGATRSFDLQAGGEIRVDRLRIELETCRAPDDNAQHGTKAFLRIWDTKDAAEPAFSGWMFAESPALSALDHPRYDVWVMSCITVSDEAAPSSE